MIIVWKDYELGKKGIGSWFKSIIDKNSSLICLVNVRGVNINKKYENFINVRKND